MRFSNHQGYRASAMKFSASVLAVFFILSQLDLPFAVSQAQTKKCCCGSTVCRCAPGEGKFCPLKKSGSAAETVKPAAHAGKSCHFSKSAKTAEPSKPVLSEVKTAKSKVTFSAARCGTNGEKASLPSHAKDFAWADSPDTFNPVIYSSGFLLNFSQTPAAWRSAIDHPPRVF